MWVKTDLIEWIIRQHEMTWSFALTEHYFHHLTARDITNVFSTKATIQRLPLLVPVSECKIVYWAAFVLLYSEKSILVEICAYF